MGKRGGDFQFLVRHNGHLTWYAVKDVPKALRAVVGKPRFVKSLQTRDIAVARSRRWGALAEFEREIQAAKQSQDSPPRRAVTLGLEWRDTLNRIRTGHRATIRALNRFGDRWGDTTGESLDQDPQGVALSNANGEIWTMMEELPRRDAEVFSDVAYGNATPLLHQVDSWIAEGGRKGPLRPRTAAQYRADLNRLATWLRASGLPETMEAVTKAVAGRYVIETIITPKVDPLTGNRWISAASAYWRWLIKRGIVESNPWQGQSLSKAPLRTREERPKRPYTDQEVRALLEGSPGDEIADLIRVAALSGMRLEEIYRLRVADCEDGWFRIRASKTHAGVRRVPIHLALKGIVTARCEGKTGAAYLFHEAGPENTNRERSAAVSKRFGRYRKGIGVDDTRDSRRASAVDFHSFRRWFITKARQQFDQPTVARVVGHEAGNITDDVYSGGPSDDRLRAVVESVRLPGTLSEPKDGSVSQGINLDQVPKRP